MKINNLPQCKHCNFETIICTSTTVRKGLKIFIPSAVYVLHNLLNCEFTKWAGQFGQLAKQKG